MKTFWSILGGVTMLALVVALPVRAEMSAVSDSDLAGITGKAINNSYLFSGTSATTLDVPEGSANIQFGWYQWTDRHGNSDVVGTVAVNGSAADTSDHKGANNQSGDSTTVQENVVADANTINWGAYSALIWVSGNENSSGSIAQMPYSTMGIGGF